MKLFALTMICAVAALPLAGCESLSRGADQVRDLATHKEEVVSYPSLLDVPAKPTPLNTAANRKQTVESLKADQAQAAGEAQDLRNAAGAMQRLPVPGQPPQSSQPNAQSQSAQPNP